MDYFDFDKVSVDTPETSEDNNLNSDTEELLGGKVEKVGEYNEIEKYYPKITGNTISRFEFCHVITQLAKYLESLTDLSKYVNTKENNNDEEISFINPAEQAFKLLMNHKFDAILQRREEKVSFSVLEIDPQDIDIIEWDFEEQHKVLKDLMKLWRFEYSSDTDEKDDNSVKLRKSKRNYDTDEED